MRYTPRHLMTPLTRRRMLQGTLDSIAGLTAWRQSWRRLSTAVAQDREPSEQIRRGDASMATIVHQGITLAYEDWGTGEPAFVFPPKLRASLEAMVAAIEAGNQEPRRQFIVNRLFRPTSDRKLVEEVLAVMMAVPSYVAANAMRGVLAFDGPAVAAQCTVPALHLATTP